MTRLDRYVGRIVAGAFGVALLFFLFLSIVMDLLRNLTKYSRQGLGAGDLTLFLLEYYAKLLPVLFTSIAPFVTVIACMFAVARLLGANEVVPMLFVGRSTQRVLRPMLVCAVLAGIGQAVCWQWVVPNFASSLAEDASLLQRGNSIQRNLVDETPGVVRHHLYVREYDAVRKVMVELRMLTEGQLARDAVLVVAKTGTWDGQRGDWRLEAGWDKRTGASRPLEWLGRPDLTPALLLQRGRQQVDPELQSYSDLVETIEVRPNVPHLRLSLHRHITYPLANLILLLIALPLAVHFERGSRLGRLLLAIGLCGAYTLFDLVCQSLGQQGWNPVVAAWSPTIVFGSLGIVMFWGART